MVPTKAHQYIKTTFMLTMTYYTLREERRLRVFENRVLRMFEPGGTR
jgi:hypothetical protein